MFNEFLKDYNLEIKKDNFQGFKLTESCLKKEVMSIKKEVNRLVAWDFDKV